MRKSLSCFGPYVLNSVLTYLIVLVLSSVRHVTQSFTIGVAVILILDFAAALNLLVTLRFLIGKEVKLALQA